MLQTLWVLVPDDKRQTSGDGSEPDLLDETEDSISVRSAPGSVLAGDGNRRGWGEAQAFAFARTETPDALASLPNCKSGARPSRDARPRLTAQPGRFALLPALSAIFRQTRLPLSVNKSLPMCPPCRSKGPPTAQNVATVQHLSKKGLPEAPKATNKVELAFATSMLRMWRMFRRFRCRRAGPSGAGGGSGSGLGMPRHRFLRGPPRR